MLVAGSLPRAEQRHGSSESLNSSPSPSEGDVSGRPSSVYGENRSEEKKKREEKNFVFFLLVCQKPSLSEEARSSEIFWKEVRNGFEGRRKRKTDG